MEITFWGVRGCIPSPGPEFNLYGGNTPCVSVRSDAGALVILDAGTGITLLGHSLMQREFAQGKGRATLLLTHGHWDHIQGFPFFSPMFVPGNAFDIYGPSKSSAMVEEILEGQMNPHFSPVHSLRNLGAKIEFKATQKSMEIMVEDLRITACFVPHGKCSAVAYRLDQGASSVVYVPDVGYTDRVLPREVERLYRGATYLIHDTTYTPEEQQTRVGRGYSSIADAARVAAQCEAQTLVMIHYDQDYTDELVDRLESRCREFLDQEPGGTAVKLVASREGLTLRI